MKQRSFEQQHEDEWRQFESHLDQLQRQHPQAQASTFPHRYRKLCQQLALAQDRHYSPHLTERLNRLVLRGHQRLYQMRGDIGRRILDFLVTGLPRRVRAEARLVWLATLLFYGPLLAIWLAIQIEPQWVYSVMSSAQVSEMAAMYDPKAERLGSNRPADTDLMMFGYYINNNIGIGFRTFASGLLFGLGSLFFLIYNGLVIGAVAGHLTVIGYHVPFFSFVAGHSGLELTGITLAGAAGLKLGFALLAPGRLPRLVALREAAKQSLELVYGMVLLLLLAAFVEAFWSSNGALPPDLKYSVGIGLWSLLLLYFLRAGRQSS